MNYDFKTDCDSNNNCNSNAKNSSEIDLDNLTFEFISEINDKLYEDLSNITNICNNFDNVKNTFFIDNEDCETTIDNEPNENIKDNNTLEDDYSKVIIAKKDKTIIGFISIYLIDESTAEICGLYCPNIAIITLAIILWRSFLMKWKISIFPFLLQKIIRQLQIFLEPMVIIQVPLNVQWLLTQTTLLKSLHPLTVQLILRKQKMKMKLYLRFLKIITTLVPVS